MNTKALFTLAIVALLAACTSMPAPVVPPPPSPPPPPVPHEQEYAVVRTYFATDRKQTDSPQPSRKFGTERGVLTYGVADVSIPHDHERGELEGPLIRGIFRENPAKHVVLLLADVTSKEQFFQSLSARIDGSKRDSALLFVHGYNVTFEDAARRTAQIAYDVRFDGAPVFYSWPSRGNLSAYILDGQNVEWSQANMERFLLDFFNRSRASNVYLIAHSMGNRALTRAIAAVAQTNPSIRSRLKEIILAAPDIDAEVFRDSIAPALVRTGAPVTLYASSEDKALAVARNLLFGGYKRAGQSGPDLMLVPGIETIDASKLETDFLGHSYIGSSKSILSDMADLIGKGKRPDARAGLLRIRRADGAYWEAKP